MRHNAHNIELAILLKLLQDNEIKSVTVEYSGGGDSGGVDGNDLAPDVASKEYLFPNQYQGTTLTTLDKIVTNVLGEFMPDGFENNDGGRGTVTLFDNGLLEHTHIDYSEDYASDDYDSETILATESGGVVVGYMRRGLDAYIKKLSDPSEVGNITSVCLSLRAMSDDSDDSDESDVEDVSLSITQSAGPSFVYLREETTEPEEAAFRQAVERFTSDNVGECCQLSFGFEASVSNGQIDISSLKLEAGYYEQSEHCDNNEIEVCSEAEVGLGALTVYIKDDKAGFYLDKEQSFLRTMEIDGMVCIGTLSEPFRTPINANSGYYALPTGERQSWRFSSVDLADANKTIRVGFGLDGLHCETIERVQQDLTPGRNQFACIDKQVINFSSLCDPDTAKQIRAKVVSRIASRLYSRDYYNYNAYQGDLQKLAMEHIEQFANNAPLDDVKQVCEISENGEIKAILESCIILRQCESPSQEVDSTPSASTKRMRI